MEKATPSVELFNQLPIPSLIFELETLRILEVNTAAVSLYGFSLEEFSYLTLKDLISNLELNKFLILSGGVQINEEIHPLRLFTNQSKAGQIIPVDARGRKLEYNGQPCILLMLNETKIADSENQSDSRLRDKYNPSDNSVLENHFESGFTESFIQKNEKDQIALLKSVISHSNEAILIMNSGSFEESEPRINYANEAFSLITGYETSEAIGQTLGLLFGSKLNLEESSRLHQAFENWQPCEMVFSIDTKKGEKLLINCRLIPLENQGGTFSHWLAFLNEVTDTSLVEEKLIQAKEIAEENDRRMNEAQKLAHLGSWYYDFINQVSQWSEETYRIWGLDPSIEVVNFIDHEKLVHPEDWERFNAVINNAIEKGIPYKMELKLLRPDGSYKTVNTIGAPVFSEDKKLIAFRGTTQDISDRILIEKELKEAKERAERSQYAMAQASILAKIGYWDHDFETNTLSCSDYIFQLFGITTRDEALSYEEAKSYFHKQSQEKISKATKELIENGTSYDLELKVINSRNEEIFVRKVIQPVYNEKDEIIGERGVLQDITEGKYLQELNREVARMVKIGSWSVDMVDQKVFWSEQIHQLHETNPKIYVPTLEEGINFYREDFREMVRSAVENTIKTGEEWDFEAVIITAKKREVWIRSLGHAEFEEGRCIRLYGGLQDINARKKAEEEKSRFQETLENSLNEIYMFNADSLKFSYVNKGAMMNLGYSSKEILNLTPIDIKPEFSDDSFREFVNPLIEKKTDKLVFFTFHKRKDASLYPVEVHLKLVEEANYRNFIAIILDITERRKAEEDLLSASERLRLATSSAKMGIWDWDVLNDRLIWDDRMYEL
ncbi:PAS domain S-box-containing protein, partial [Algoriphagus faecimaris]